MEEAGFVVGRLNDELAFARNGAPFAGCFDPTKTFVEGKDVFVYGGNGYFSGLVHVAPFAIDRDGAEAVAKCSEIFAGQLGVLQVIELIGGYVGSKNALFGSVEEHSRRIFVIGKYCAAFTSYEV